MFTGIVTAKGVVTDVSGETDRRFVIESAYDPDTIEIGASISHAGACLTVVDKVRTDTGAQHAVDVSPETLTKTTLGDWTVGQEINLERALRIGDELGGHLVTGHIDGVGRLEDVATDGEWTRLTFSAPSELSRFIAGKGSIAIDGVSLTVNAVDATRFSVMIIPHTASVTTLGQLQIGARVNLEVDLMARYAARLMQAKD